MGPNAIGSPIIIDGAVNTADLADGSIGSDQLAAGAIDANAVADLAISTEKIADGAVTGRKFAQSSISADHVVEGSVTVGKVQLNSVSSVVIADGAISAAHVAEGAVTSGKFEDGAITTAHIVDDAVGTEQFASETLGNSNIADGAITSDKIVDNTVIGDNIADSAITGSKLTENTIGWQHFTIEVFDQVQDAVLEMGAIEKKLRTLKSRCLADETAQKNLLDLVTMHRGVYLLAKHDDHSVYCSGPEGGVVEENNEDKPLDVLFKRLQNFGWGTGSPPVGSKHYNTLSAGKPLPTVARTDSNSAVSTSASVWVAMTSLLVIVFAW